MRKVVPGHFWYPNFKIALRSLVFFSALSLIAVSQFFIISNSSADEITAASPPAHTGATPPETAKIEIAANVPPFQKATMQIVVSISINRESKGDFFVELDDNGELYVKHEDLVGLKLNISEDRTVLIRDEKYAPLSALRDVTYTFDDKNLIVAILGKTAEERRTVIEFSPPQYTPKNVYYPHETSAFLNYGLTYSYADPRGFESFNIANTLGVRAGDIFLVSDSLYTKTPTGDQFVRLFSNVTYERRSDLQWLVLGDQFASSGYLGSSVNMGGIGFSKVYKLDPYFIKQPMFNLQGVTAFPSQAKIYMDGVLVGTQPIAPGAFDLKNIYTNAGAHKIEVVLTDPFGNEQKILYPLYFSDLLLREGLHEYSYNLGFLREQYGVESNKYGKPVFSAFHRYGVTSSFNIGAQTEGSEDIYNGGITTSLLIPRAGAFILSLAGSSNNGKAGVAGSFQHSYQLGNFSTNLLIHGFSKYYATVGTFISPPSDVQEYAWSMVAGYSFPILGDISLGYSERGIYSGSSTRIVASSYSKGLSRSTSLFASASATRIVNTTYSFFVGLNFNFGKNYRGTVQYNKTGSTNTETIQIQKDQPIGEGLGYQASLNRLSTGTSSSESFNPYIQYNARYGIYSANSTIQHSNDSTSESYTVSAAGSIVYTGGFYGISRPVSDSFGIVMVDTLPNVAVFNNGSEMGKTGSSGMVVVPSLTSYNENLITLTMKDIPMDYSVVTVNTKISPPLWSGSCIAFDAIKTCALTGFLYVKKDDKKIPLEYIDISIQAGERELTFPTGKAGEFFIENTIPEDPKRGAYDKQSCSAIAERRKSGGNVIKTGTYRALVDYGGGKCEFSITFPTTEDMITDLGEIQCVVTHSPGSVPSALEHKMP